MTFLKILLLASLYIFMLTGWNKPVGNQFPEELEAEITSADAELLIPQKTSALPLLWSEDHKAIVSLAQSLVDAPEIQKAREEVVAIYENSPSGRIADGKAMMPSAIDELLNGVLLITATHNLAAPKIVWSETLGYTVGDFVVPDSRYAGETPDRIYRNIVLSPAYRYELRGHRGESPSLDFIVEVIPGPANWGLPPLSVLQNKDISYEDDGSFRITMDSSPADGRTNHLQLPDGTQGLLIRDTVVDWSNHRPRSLSIIGLSDSVPDEDRQSLVIKAADTLVKAARVSLKFYQGIWQRELNQLTTYVRDLGWGIVGLNRFSIRDDEALVVTVDPLGAGYFGLQVDDLWLRSVNYYEHMSSLNIEQAQPNSDGSYTFVVSIEDPGYYNWIDTGGINDGFLVARWEIFEKATKGEGAVRSVKHLHLSELAGAMPKEARLITQEERSIQLAQRRGSYSTRLGK